MRLQDTLQLGGVAIFNGFVSWGWNSKKRAGFMTRLPALGHLSELGTRINNL